MTTDNMTALVDHIFAELERLSDESMTPEQLRDEVERAKSIGTMANTIISAGNLMIRAAEFQDNKCDANAKLPRLLGESNG